MKRLKFEQNIPKNEKIKENRFGLQMDMHYEGVQIPQYDFPPLLRVELLSDVQRLLLKYNYLEKKVNWKKCINNSFVEKLNKRFE